MNRLDLDTRLVLFTMTTFLVAYVFTFPLGWLISDVYSYLNQGMAIANGEKLLTYTDAISQETIAYGGTKYPLGNAFWIAFWAKLCNLNYVYIGSLFSILFSIFLLFKVLSEESHFKLALLLIFIFPSLAFFSNTLMSSMPSFILVCSFLYGLFIFDESGKKWFLLSLIAALSFWVRETNLVFLGGICLIHFIQDRRWFLHYAGGAIMGFLPRIISSGHYYGDPMYYVLAENFSILNFVNNAGVYAIILICFMPLGLFLIGRYRGRYKTPLIASTALFILMYCFYSFNATTYSGFKKGIILMGRFMIPILPIYIIATGWYFRNKTLNPTVKMLATVLTCALIVGMQVAIHKEAKIHKKISNHIYSNYTDKMVMYDLSRTTNIVRYINPFHGNLSYISDISKLEDEGYMNKLFQKFDDAYLIQTLNTSNSDKQNYTSKIDMMVQSARRRYTTEEVEKIKIKPALFLQVVRVERLKIGEIGEIGKNEKSEDEK